MAKHGFSRQEGLFEQLNASRRRNCRCIVTPLTIDDPEGYKASLAGLLGDETLDQAINLIDGEIRFFGLKSP